MKVWRIQFLGWKERTGMRNLLIKEYKLSSSLISYFFILFGFMFFLPGYPVLCGSFFVSLGVFKSFQYSIENNDIIFSSILPIAKKDIVKGKFLFTCSIQLFSVVLMLIAVILRMTVMVNFLPYRTNALMNANLFALGCAVLIFGVFNLVFLTGFFKTGYKYGKPFILFIIVCFVLILIAESLHYIPGMEWINSFGTDNLYKQIALLFSGILIYTAFTFFAYGTSCRLFDKIDL